MRSTFNLYQIEVADFTKRPKRELVEDGGILRTMPNGNVVKLEDVLPPAPTRTLLRWAKDIKTAKKLGAKCGTVLACFKAQNEPYLKNIEFFKPVYKPVNIEVRLEEFTVNKNLEVTRQKEKDFNIEIA